MTQTIDPFRLSCPLCLMRPGMPCRTEAGKDAKRPHRIRVGKAISAARTRA